MGIVLAEHFERFDSIRRPCSAVSKVKQHLCRELTNDVVVFHDEDEGPWVARLSPRESRLHRRHDVALMPVGQEKREGRSFALDALHINVAAGLLGKAEDLTQT